MMIPLLLLLGLGVALTAYELSPKSRSRIDDYARVLREAHEAHRVADAHLSNAGTAAAVATQHAQTSTHPQDAHANAGQVATDAGVVHAVAATEANQEAARKTTELAQKAKTEAERLTAAQSAGKVIEREKEIADLLPKLGVGQCGVRSYAHVSERVKDQLLTKLPREGMSVTGNNPWDIDTRQHGVKLRAVWDARAQELKLVVTTGKIWGLISCDDIWKQLDPKLKEVGAVVISGGIDTSYYGRGHR